MAADAPALVFGESAEGMPYVDLSFPVPWRMWEPMTVLTDLVLSLVFFWAAASLPGARTGPAASLRRTWTAFFSVVGVSPILGAIVHGVDAGEGTVWCLNLVCIAIGTWCMETQSLLWLTKGRHAWWHLPLRVLFTAQVLYCIYYIAFVSSAFFVIIVDYAPTQLVNTALHLVASCASAKDAFGREHAAASRTLLLSMLTMLFAAGLQASKLSPHPWFNHNDLYHVVQCYSTYLMFKGASKAIVALDTHLAAGAGKKKRG